MLVNSWKWKSLWNMYFSSLKSKIILLRLWKKVYSIHYIVNRSYFWGGRWLENFIFYVAYVTRISQSLSAFQVYRLLISSQNQLKPSFHETGTCLSLLLLFLNVPEMPYKEVTKEHTDLSRHFVLSPCSWLSFRLLSKTQCCHSCLGFLCVILSQTFCLIFTLCLTVA